MLSAESAAQLETSHRFAALVNRWCNRNKRASRSRPEPEMEVMRAGNNISESEPVGHFSVLWMKVAGCVCVVPTQAHTVQEALQCTDALHAACAVLGGHMQKYSCAFS